ncbi:hypothetical protein WISP_00636 [Willisornis vidua]|uniref:Ig-like domain-containing protein n=1 Tax=Willisornis vidua TaxID=1566151 RepID=A0ABQ9DV93_9PASS|nr:hypothetical protein WISP_00636 [Willisornis vidua]
MDFGPPGDHLVEFGPPNICPTPDLHVTLLSDPNQAHPDQPWVHLLCLVEGRGSDRVRATWLVNGDPAHLEQVDVTCQRCSGGRGTFSSRVNLSRSSWDVGAEVTCRVTHPEVDEDVVAKISTFCSGERGGGDTWII